MRDLTEQLADLRKQLEQAENGLGYIENTKTESQTVTCAEHGHYTEHKRVISSPFGKNFESRTRCPACIRKEINALEQRQAVELERKRSENIVNLQKNSGISQRFMAVSFDNFEKTDKNLKAFTACKRYADKWLERKAVGGGLVLFGKPGTGKNHLACAIAHQVINEHQSSVYLTTALRLTRKVKSTWGNNSELSEEKAIAFYATQDLLIIDEIGVQFGSEAEKIILFEVINERYEQMRPTILISNLDEKALTEYVSERIIDRMREGNGMLLKFDWESYRK